MQIEKASHDAFLAIFPKYAQLLQSSEVHSQTSLETFLREQLPAKIEMVRNIEACFNNFLNGYTNSILKRPQQRQLIHSLILKATQKTEKYFHALTVKIDKNERQNPKTPLTFLNLADIRIGFRARLTKMEELLRDKYFLNRQMEHQCQEEATVRLYNLLELYHFTKSDLPTISNKYRLKVGEIFKAINMNSGADEIDNLLYLDTQFSQILHQTVAKRCRPFINKRDFLTNKVREVLKQTQSKVVYNPSLLVQSIVSKQKYRVTKEICSSLQKSLRAIQQNNLDLIEDEIKQIMSQVQAIKKEFSGVKNNPYFIDIIRGTFEQKYKMEFNKLENIYYLTNLEKYLQDVATFLQKLLAVEERIIANRKLFMKDFGNQVQLAIGSLCTDYQIAESAALSLQQVIDQEFQCLESSLYGVVNRTSVVSVDRSHNKPASSQNMQTRRKQLQEQRARKALQKQLQLQKREQQQKIRCEKQRAEIERLKQQKKLKEEKQRRKRQQDMKLREQQKLKREQAIKTKQAEARKERQAEEEKRKEKLALEIKLKKEKEAQEQVERENKLKAERDLKSRLAKQQQEKERQLMEAEARKKEDELKAKRQRELQEKRQSEKAKELALMEERKQKEKQALQQLKEAEEEREKQRVLKEAQEKAAREEKEREAKEKMEQQEKKERDRQERERKERNKKEKEELELKKKQKEEREERERIQRDKEEREKKAQLEKEREERERKAQLEREKEERERKAQLQRQKEEREKKAQIQREKQERQQKQGKQKEKQQQQRKRNQRQKQEKQLREMKQQQQKQRKESQRQAKQKQARQKAAKEAEELQRQLKQAQKLAANKSQVQKEKKKASSGINYGELEDICDEDLEQMEKAGKINPKQELDYEDDFDAQSPEKQEKQIDAKFLIGPEDIKCLNEYMKGTQYARKNKINLEPYNQFEQYNFLLEDLINSRKVFVLSSAVSNAILKLAEQVLTETVTEEEIEDSLQNIEEHIKESYVNRMEAEQIDPTTVFILPFSFANPQRIKIIQFSIISKLFTVIYDREPNQQSQKCTDISTELINRIFSIQGQDSDTQIMVLKQQTAQILQTFEKELPCMLLVFAMHYQHQNKGQIIINQYTIQRFFYVLQTTTLFYDIDQNQQLKMNDFYEKFQEKQQAAGKIRFEHVEIDINDPKCTDKLSSQAEAIKKSFKNGTVDTCLCLFQIYQRSEDDNEQRVSLFVSMQRKPKLSLSYYLIIRDQSQDNHVLDIFDNIQKGSDGFEVTVYQDFTRHMALMEYWNWTMPLWGHIINKKKMGATQALRVLLMALAPYLIAYKQMD